VKKTPALLAGPLGLTQTIKITCSPARKTVGFAYLREFVEHPGRSRLAYQLTINAFPHCRHHCTMPEFVQVRLWGPVCHM
jgi:hypothetical protein